MGSAPVYTTSSGQESMLPRLLRGKSTVAEPSHALILSEATPIVLHPEEGYVTIGVQALPAFGIIDDEDTGPDGRIGRFKVEGKRYTYTVEIYPNRVVVQTFCTDPGDPPIYYGGDVKEFTRIGQCARFLLDDLIPDCLAALEGRAING